MRAAIRCRPRRQAARGRDAERRVLRKASAAAFDRAGCPSGARPAPTRGYRRRPSGQRQRAALRSLEVRNNFARVKETGRANSFTRQSSRLLPLHPFSPVGFLCYTDVAGLHRCYRPPRRPESFVRYAGVGTQGVGITGGRHPSCGQDGHGHTSSGTASRGCYVGDTGQSKQAQGEVSRLGGAERAAIPRARHLVRGEWIRPHLQGGRSVVTATE